MTILAVIYRECGKHHNKRNAHKLIQVRRVSARHPMKKPSVKYQHI